MQSKKKLKKKTATKKATPRAELVKVTGLVSKLKRSGLSKSSIAKRSGYNSHNTVTHWFKTNTVPKHLVKKLTAMVEA